MTLQSTDRHRRIARIQAKIFGGIAAVITVLTLAFGGVQTIQNSTAADKAAAAETRADFWRVVSGEVAPQGATSLNKLAVDLREGLGFTDATATALPETLNEFSAGPSDYPGIVRDLGITPFNDAGLNCSDCGPLNGYMRNQLMLIKQGNLGAVIDSEIASAPKVEGLTLTPLGMSGYLWVGFLYVTGSIGALVLAVRRDTKTNGYDQRLLNWKSDGGSSADPYKRISHLISPLYFVSVVPIRRKLGKDYQGALHEMGIDGLHMIVRRELKKLDALPEGERHSSESNELRRQLEEALTRLNEQVSTYDSNVEVEEQDADQVRREVAASLESVFGTLRIRDESRATLDTQNPLEEIERAASQKRLEIPPATRTQPPDGQTSPRSSSR